MTIDLEQFKVTYIEESFEGLAVMETCLLELEVGSDDTDAINTIFRSAHSIKGGGATFGFSDITDFTHVVETLLDEVRNGERQVTQESIDLFLQSVDCVRNMLNAARDNTEIEDPEKIEQVKNDLEKMLGVTEVAGSDVPNTEKVSDDNKPNNDGWKILFKPTVDMLKTGNDVVRMFRELDELGRFQVKANFDQLPPLTDMDPEECYISWEISLSGEIEKEQINDIFVWVEDDCELVITSLKQQFEQVSQIQESDKDIKQENKKPEVKAVTPASERRAGSERRQAKSSSESSSIRVDIDKIDALINMVGELVITQSMLSQLGSELDVSKLEKLQDGLGQLERNTRELQENVMQIRMIPISFAFNRFPRMVHDMCNKLNKKVQLKLSGESTELDKTVMEKIGDPLVHLVRNSMDHGIETPEERVANGKPDTGTVHLNAYHQGGNIVIEITDDGAGLNKEKIIAKAIERGLIENGGNIPDSQIYSLIFHPGFSTADQVTDVSGRGVGMDVVKKNIQALSGTVDVDSKPGEGSTFTIRLPLTLAILDGQLIQVSDETYIIPLVSIIESLQIDSKYVNEIAGKAELYKLRDDYIPIIRLGETFGIDKTSKELEKGLLVVVEGDHKKVGLLVDDLLAQQQVVIKSLESNYKKVEGLSGATILGDGTVALIIDVTGIIKVSQDSPVVSGLQAVTDKTVAA